MRHLPLGPMQAFVTVARTRSLAEAATIMHLTVPALSRRIAALEAHLGVALFHRLPRGLRLTEAGSAYFAELGPAWDAMAAATEAAAQHGHRRPLRVSVMPSLAANWLVPRLEGFRERANACDIALHTAAEVEDLSVRTDLDCAIRLGKGPWPGVQSEAFLLVDAYPVASPSFGLLAGAPDTRLHPADLLTHTLIGTHHQPDFWQEWFNAAIGSDMLSATMSRMTYRSFDNLQVVYEAAAAGMGIALGLDPVVRPFLDRGHLRRLLPNEVRLPRQFHLVRRPSRLDRVHPGFAAFRRWLRAEAAAFSAGP